MVSLEFSVGVVYYRLFFFSIVTESLLVLCVETGLVILLPQLTGTIGVCLSIEQNLLPTFFMLPPPFS